MGRLVYGRDHERIEAEARLGGLYVLRTGEPAQRLSPEDTVCTCKGLADVERWVPNPQGARPSAVRVFEAAAGSTRPDADPRPPR